MEAPALQPGEVAIDHDQIQNMNKELEDAAAMELPEGEDEDFWANLFESVITFDVRYCNVESFLLLNNSI